MKTRMKAPIQPDWWSKTFAGGILGLSFSIAIGSLIIVVGRPYIAMDLLGQLGLWAIAWVWMPIMFLCYFFRHGKKAILVLCLANLLAYACLFWLRG